MVKSRKKQPKGTQILSPEDVEKMRVVGRFAAGMLRRLGKLIEPGVTTGQIDAWVHEWTEERGAISAPYGYPAGSRHPFPGHCCTSVNNVVCHGIPNDKQVLKEGDIINVDVTPILDGFHGDTSRTYQIGTVDPEARRLIDDTYEAMRRGIAVVKPGATVGDIGHAIQRFSEGRGHGVVRSFTGHGIGRIFHTEPTIFHYGRPGEGAVLEPGMTFTIEPMLNGGDWRCVMLSDHWTAVTADGSLSAQFEHTLTVTEDGVEVLTLAEGKTFDLDVGE